MLTPALEFAAAAALVVGFWAVLIYGLERYVWNVDRRD